MSEPNPDPNGTPSEPDPSKPSTDPSKPSTDPSKPSTETPPDEPPQVDPTDPGLQAQLCNFGGWCWVEPTPFGESITSIHGTPDGSVVFGVGRQGLVVESRAEGAKYHEPGTSMDLLHVRVITPEDVYVGGTQGLLHYDGASWTPVHVGSVGRITTTSDGQLWAVIDEQIWRFGEGFVDVVPGAALRFTDIVAGEAPSELWALAYETVGRGFQAWLYLFDGSSWSERSEASPHDYSLPRLTRAGSDVYAYTSSAMWRPTAGWEPVDIGWGPQDAWGAPDGSLYLAMSNGLMRWDASGSTWLSKSDHLRTVWGTAANELWIATVSGGMSRVPAERALSRTPIDEPVRRGRDWSESAWGTVPPELWADSTPTWGSGPNDVWRSSLEHFDGTRWTKMGDHPSGAVDIDGSGPNDVWFALWDAWYPEETPKMLHWDGQALSEHVFPEEWRGFRISRVRAMNATEVWIGAQSKDRARLARFDGATWHVEHEVDPKPLVEHWLGIEGFSSRFAWIAAADGLYQIHGGLTTVLRPEQEERFVSLSADGGDVCVLGTQNVYCRDRVSGEFIAERYARNPLYRVAFTSDFVWLYDGSRAVRRPR